MNMLPDISKTEIEHQLVRTLNLSKTAEISFDYVFNSLQKLNHFTDFNKDDFKIIYKFNDNEYLESGTFKEGKNYHWSAGTVNGVDFIVRKYKQHFTLYLKSAKTVKLSSGTVLNKKQYLALTINTDTEVEYYLWKQNKSTIPDYDEDFFWINPFYDFNLVINEIVDTFKDEHFHLIENTAQVERPKRVIIERCFETKGLFSFQLTRIDKSIYCLEELTQMHHQLFAETDMLEKIKSLKINDQLADKNFVVTDILTDTKNGSYYHSAGIRFKKYNDDDIKSRWADVYSLTSYHYHMIFKEN